MLAILKDRSRTQANSNLFRLLLLVLTCILAFAALILPIAIRTTTYAVEIGDVASQSIQAPSTLSYVSEVLTEQARQEAETAITPVYLPADPSITRGQIEKLHITFNYINTVRSDAYATTEQKLADLQAIENGLIHAELAKQLLNLSDSRWETIQQEALNVLEQAMRNTIREDQLLDAKRNLPTLISFSLPQDQAAIVSELVTQFVVPNSLRSEEQTELARQEARNAIKPITSSFVAGETIVQRGQVITPEIWEALEQYGLIQPHKNLQSILSAAILVILIGAFLILYFSKRKITPLNDARSLIMIAICLLVFLFGARLVVPNRTVVPYLFPLAAFGLTIASLYSFEIGLVLSLVLSTLTTYGLSYGLELTLYYLIGSLAGVLVLGRGRRLANFFVAGLAVGAAGSAVILAYRLPDSITDWIGIATLVLASLLNGVASASLTLLLQYLFSQILGMTTALQLLDISRPDHPLLQFILRQAPGTYQHSLQVANLAEQAAEAIGADALLVRVGAIYHDAGKALNPSFFIENQIPGSIDSHDDIDPTLSSSTIVHHVLDGVALARKYRLPPRIQDFIREHHGTLVTRYQYMKAVEKAGGDPSAVDPAMFRYPGPPPRSRETALLMLADGCEARARSELPKSEEELREIVKKVIDYCQREGQLDNTTLTLRDLHLITESYVHTLLNTHHPRIQYPEAREKPHQANPERADSENRDATATAVTTPLSSSSSN